MSTFDGIVHEFPSIRIDCFRHHADRRPPLACFLSHVHSDHLAGLETLKSPFVFCSAATREILLRLVRYPCRINYANGMIEKQEQTYKHLRNLLKPIPLDTPTVLELEPGNEIQVILIDANHCTGSVMFLIEGNGKAILYTGDLRSENWWVNSVARNPCLVEYSSGLKTLDCIYLDTSVLDTYELQSKAQGLKELIEKVTQYPDNTVFCFQAWTYGYEEAWIALSKALKSKIHVDEYKMGIYKSLMAKSTPERWSTQVHLSREAPYLVGFTCGNQQHEGCLTLDEGVRIHSCEKGTPCSVMQTNPVVWIKPIVARLPGGEEIAEVGIGGGGDDLGREAELEYLTPEDVLPVMDMINKCDAIPVDIREQMQSILLRSINSGRNISLNMDIADFDDDLHTSMLKAIHSIAQKAREAAKGHSRTLIELDQSLSSRITFPYARHSSYPELHHIVELFKPKDVWPCTVDELYWHRNGITIREYFGDACSGKSFSHDIRMNEWQKEFFQSQDSLWQEGDGQDTQHIASSELHSSSSPALLHDGAPRHEEVERLGSAPMTTSSPAEGNQPCAADSTPAGVIHEKRTFTQFHDVAFGQTALSQAIDGDSQGSALSARAYEARIKAFRAMSNEEGYLIHLISTTDDHTTPEKELGTKK